MTGTAAGPGPARKAGAAGVQGLAGLAREVARLALAERDRPAARDLSVDRIAGNGGGRDSGQACSGSARTTWSDGAKVTRSVRVGIDGPIEADTAELADAVTKWLVDDAVPVGRVRATDFLRPRSVRLEYGRDDADAFYQLWYDFPALRREVLDPLAAGGRGSWLPRLRDPQTDRSARVSLQKAAPGTVAVVDGRFLLRDDVRPGFDVLVHLDVSEPARRRRLPADEAARVLPAWQQYLDECRPAEHAELLVRFDHPDRPALIVAR